MNYHLVLWAVIASLYTLPSHGCISARFYPLPFENLHRLDSRLTKETLRDFDKFTLYLNEAFKTRTMRPNSDTLTVIYDPGTSRLCAIGGTPSDYQLIEQTIKRTAFLQAIYSISMPATVLSITLWGLALHKRARGQKQTYGDYPVRT